LEKHQEFKVKEEYNLENKRYTSAKRVFYLYPFTFVRNNEATGMTPIVIVK